MAMAAVSSLAELMRKPEDKRAGQLYQAGGQDIWPI